MNERINKLWLSHSEGTGEMCVDSKDGEISAFLMTTAQYTGIVLQKETVIHQTSEVWYRQGKDEYNGRFVFKIEYYEVLP